MKKTPKEKAIELANKYVYYVESLSCEQQDENAKQCALIAVDEVLEAITFNTYDEESYNQENNYWENVKKEIELL